MSTRSDVATMVRGMGMGMKVLELLVNEAEKQGADPTAFAFLTRPRFKGNLEQIGKVIAECDWRIPASEMRRRARKNHKEDFYNKESLEVAINLWWSLGCLELGVPFQSYCQDPDHGDPAIPTILWEALHKQPMQYPLIISPFIANPKRKDVIVNFGTRDGYIYDLGEAIDMNKVEAVAVADCKYFDFEK